MDNQSALSESRKQAKTMARRFIKEGTKTDDSYIFGWDDGRPIVIHEKNANSPIDLVSEPPDWYIRVHETTIPGKRPFWHEPIVMVASVKKGGPTVIEAAEIEWGLAERKLGRFKTVKIWSGLSILEDW